MITFPDRHGAAHAPWRCVRCVQFADTILKKYSSVIGTIWTAVLSYVMFGHLLTINFFLGVSIVFVSMHQ